MKVSWSSFSPHLGWTLFLSGVRPCIFLSVFLKTFHIFDSFYRTTGPVLTNLAQISIGWKRFTFVEMEGHCLFQGEIIRNYFKLFGIFQKTFGQKNSNLGGSIFRYCRFKFVQIIIPCGRVGPHCEDHWYFTYEYMEKNLLSLNIWPKKAVSCVEALSGSVDSIKDNQIMVTGIRIGLQMGGGIEFLHRNI